MDDVNILLKPKKFRCKQCGSTQTYKRVLTNERVCRICGAIIKEEDKK